jgi:hypothetical protein
MGVELDFAGRLRGPKSLGTATLGTAWATLGTANVRGARFLSAWVDLTINTSIDPRFRLRGRVTAAGSGYVLPTRTVTANVVRIEPEYYELLDADVRQILPWDLDAAVPFVEFQASVGTAGGTAAVLNAANIFTGI